MVAADDLVLVTGANGFVGSHLVEALLARGYRVRCMVRRSSDLNFIRDLPVEWAYADLREGDALHEACRGVDVVIHCAALTRAPNQATFMRANTEGTQTLAQAAVAMSPRLQRFLFISSQAVAGPSAGPEDYVDESRAPNPISWYGKSKWAAEQALQAMSSRLPLTIVRPSSVYGPRDKDFLSYFKLVKRGATLELGHDRRMVSLVYVHDLAAMLLRSLENEAAGGQTYFCCGGGHSYRELGDAIARSLGKRARRVRVPEAVLTPIELWSRAQARVTGRPALLNPQRVLDLRHPSWLCSAKKAEQELGFLPQYSLQAGVHETAAWYRENRWL